MGKRRSSSIDSAQRFKRHAGESKDHKETWGCVHRSDNQIDDVVASIRAAFDLDQRAKTIAESTRVIDELLNQQVLLLDIRARTHAKNAEFTAALSDCDYMIKNASSMAIGYLCTGEIYEMQGRQQAAIDVYKRGLTYVPAAREAERHQLEENKDRAHAKLQTRVDFIAHLPFDILSIVVAQFFTGKIPGPTTYYLKISRTWRNRLYQCAPNLHLTLSHITDFAFEHGYPRLSEAGPYIHRLTIRGSSNRLHYSLLNQLITVDFGALRALHFDCCTTDKPIMLLKVIRKLGATLTCLKLERFEHVLSVDTLLISCPNLETLEFRGIGNSEVHFDDASDTFKLKSLKFDMINHELKGSALLNILSRCPMLETLALPFCRVTDCFEAIKMYCPGIKSISLNSSFYLELEREARRMTRRTCNAILPVTQGIELLEVRGILADEIKQFGIFLAKAGPTLRALRIEIIKDSKQTTDWLPEEMDSIDNLKPIRFPNLRIFHCQYSEKETEPAIAAVLREAPLLERVMFDFTTHVADDALIALMPLDNLRELELRECDNVQVDLLQQLLKNKIASQKLERLVLEINNSLGHRFTPELASRVASLTELVVSNFSELSHSDFLTFAQNLHELPHLRLLQLRSMRSVTDRALSCIATLHMLEELALYCLESITDTGITVLSTCLTLKRLSVEACRFISYDAVDSVMQKLGMV